MGQEINLLNLYPKAKRNFEKRKAVSQENRELARKFGKEYFDGTRDQGYGGFKYDGRWVPIVKRFKEYYGLADDASILDVGCAKGFMLKDFQDLMPKAKLAGIDISEYAIENTVEDVKDIVKLGNAKKLDFEDNSFDLVISINTVHNLELEECKTALKEIERVSKKYSFVTMDAWRNEEEKERMLAWNLTGRTYMHVNDWEKLFSEIGYTGDYYWFIAQ